MLTFSIQNTCGETRRLLIIPPRTPTFSLNYEPVGGLAPGLDVRAEVEFQLPDDDEVDNLGVPFAPGEIREYVDKFVVISGNDKVKDQRLSRTTKSRIYSLEALPMNMDAAPLVQK